MMTSYTTTVLSPIINDRRTSLVKLRMSDPPDILSILTDFRTFLSTSPACYSTCLTIVFRQPYVYCKEKNLYRTVVSFYESISVLNPVGRTLISHTFIEYFAPSQLFQKTPVAVESLPRKYNPLRFAKVHPACHQPLL